VKEEALNLIERAHSMIVLDFRSELKPFLEKQGVKQLTNRDGMVMSLFFSERKRSLRTQVRQESDVQNEIIGTIENYVASRLHSLKDGLKIPVDNFLAGMMTELATIKHDLQAPFKSMKTIDITPDDSIVSLVVIGVIMSNADDARHLASIIQHQFQQNKWIIFVTNDEKDILSKQNGLSEIFALHCSKPEWALDHYRHVTRLKSPVEYFRQLPNYSHKQKEFGETIEKIIGTRILG
jgi:hypothetical protein